MQSGFTSGFYITKKAWDDPVKRDLAVKLVEKMTATAAIKDFCATGGIPSDAQVVIADQSKLQVSMNSMPARTISATLPLSDAAKAQTFPTLVEAANSYITGNEANIIAALKSFANKQ
jgi:raffinose/stachyose/melibiose transport system substrate-binding protein